MTDPAPLLVSNPRGPLRALTPSFVGASTPAPVRAAITRSRKAGADNERAERERVQAAERLRAAAETAAAADREALAAGEDVPLADPEAEAEAALRRAERRALAAAGNARASARDATRVIAEAAPEWLPVLAEEFAATLTEREAPGFVLTADYLERVDSAFTRLTFVRAIAEGRVPGRGDRLERAKGLLAEVDAILDDYPAALVAADAAAARAAEYEHGRLEWERKAAERREREAEHRRRRDAERRRFPADAEVIR
jgi:hypothetical protein